MQRRLIKSFEVPGPIAMMDCNKAFKFFAIGGRQHLQIVELNVHAQPENMFTKRGVIKSKGSNDNPINQKPGVNDISWNKIFQDKVAIGCTSGIVSIYEINEEARAKLLVCNGVKMQHESNISQVEWSPHSPNILISASVEKQLKFWDLRIQKDTLSITSRSIDFDNIVKIKDVKFSPHEEEKLAIGYESGAIEIFDIRKIVTRGESGAGFLMESTEGQSLKRLIYNGEAHSRTANTLHWNPDNKNLLASGSIEKKIAVWDVGGPTMKQVHKIEHVSSCSMIRWMKKQPNVIGASSLNDNFIYLYDTKFQNRLKAIYKGHPQAVKCFLYDPDEQYIVSASLTSSGSNTSLIVQDIRNYIDTYEYCPRMPVTIDPFNNILFNLEDIDGIMKKQDIDRDIYILKDFRHLNSKNIDQKRQLIELHIRYLRSGTKQEMSRHNSEVAADIGKTSCVDLWRNIFTMAFPQTNLTHTIESLYEERIEANVNISEDRVYLHEKYKYKKEVARVNIEQVLQRFIDEEGELQTVAIAVLGLLSIDKNVLHHEFAENILTPYIELLRKMELYWIATRTIIDSGIESLTRATNKYTQFKIGCGNCKESIKEGIACSKCKTTPLCILCQEHLDGLVIWCQYCAHGGHLKEYRDWFSKEEVCPYGCRHKCFDFKST